MVDVAGHHLYDHGSTALVPIVQGVGDLATALADGPVNLERGSATTCRLMTLNLSRVPLAISAQFGLASIIGASAPPVTRELPQSVCSPRAQSSLLCRDGKGC